MNLDRRQFFTLAAAAAVAPFVPPVVAPFVPPIEASALVPLVAVDPITKTIAALRPMTLLEFHRAIVEAFDSVELITEDIPTVRYTDQLFAMQNEWQIAGNSWRKLHKGTQAGGRWDR